jgi:integrase
MAGKTRGIFERPVGSRVWWISYYDADGKRRREKIGTRANALKAYQDRKADIRAGRKLPPVRMVKPVTLGDLIDLALEYAKDHKDLRSYVSRAAILREGLGRRPASEITPQEIDRWLTSRRKSAASFNRYKSLISLCYREGLRNGRVSINPARLVRQRKEPTGRKAYLSKHQYRQFIDVLSPWPDKQDAFIVSVNTGMRLTEQFTTEWSQVQFDRRIIRLIGTKNGSDRDVQLNADSMAALMRLKGNRKHPIGRVFEGKGADFGTRSWFTAAVSAVGIKDYTWHGNRHTFCSWIAEAGATQRESMEAAGHKSVAMSARYAHLSPEHKLSIVDRIAAEQFGEVSF